MGKFDGFMIISDIDGTLTDDKHMLSAENKNAIEYFKSEGGIFTIATGRLHDYFREKCFDKIINCPVVLLNGAGIYDFDKNDYLYLKSFDENYKDVLNFITSVGGFLHIHFNYKDDGIDSAFETKRTDNPSKIVVAFDDELSAMNLRDKLRERFKDDYEIFRSWNTGVEVLPKGATKGNALKILKQQLNDISVTAAIGDYENDISLIKVADISFVPENAVKELKEKADYIVAHHCKNAVKEMIEILEKYNKPNA